MPKKSFSSLCSCGKSSSHQADEMETAQTPVKHGSKPGPCKGKKWLVTGGSRGIGKAIVEEVYAQGGTVYVVARNEATLAALKQELPGVHTISVDIGNWDATRKAIESLEPMDCLVNNAAEIPGDLSFWGVTPESMDKVFNVALKAIVNISQVVAQKMIDAGKPGAIVNVTGLAAQKVIPMILFGGTIKAGVEMLSKGMALELAKHKITVNTVSPAAVATDLMLGGLSSPDEETRKKTEGFLKAMEQKTPTGLGFMPVQDVVSAVMFFGMGVTSQVTGERLIVDGGQKINF